MRLVTFLVRNRTGTATEDTRRAYGQSLQAVSHLLSEAEHESLRDLLKLPAQEIPGRLEELPRQWVDLIVSNSPACLQLLERTNAGDAGRRVLVPLSESVGLAVVISVLGSRTLNFRPMQPASEFDLSAGFRLELENGRAVRIDRERCQNGPGCDVSITMTSPEPWERDFMTELALAKVVRVRSLARPETALAVDLGGAEKVRRAFGCIVDR